MMNEYELAASMGVVYYREYPAWYRLGLHRINNSWKKWIRNPFQVQSFFEYRIESIQKGSLNPCREIALEKSAIQIGRKIESPYSLTSFTEWYEIGPWEAEHPMMKFVYETT